VLPVADALDLAFMHASREEDNRSILQGIELIRNMLNTFFSKYDVRAIDAWGQPFDPRLHEALGVEHHPKVPPIPWRGWNARGICTVTSCCVRRRSW
jgi:molecular chaperone GrpE